MNKKTIGVSIEAPYGVIPETFKVPITIDESMESVLLGLSDIHRILANQMVQECLYRTDLAWRKKKKQSMLANEEDQDTRTTAFSLNYVLGDLKKRNLFKEFSQVRLQDARGTVLYIAGAFDSYFKLKKKGDTKARKPRMTNEHFFQTIVWQGAKVRGGAVQLVHMLGEEKQTLCIAIPKSTEKKIGDRDIIHAKIVRIDRNVAIPSRYTLEMVCHQPTPEPQPLKRCAGVNVGAGGVAFVDSRGHKRWFNMRRSDKFWRPKVLAFDRKMKELRTMGKENSSEYLGLKESRRKMLNRMSRQLDDYQRKLAHYIVDLADVFFVGQDRVRLGLAQSKDGTAKEHWGVQNTGALSRLVAYIEWNAKKSGKVVVKIDNPEGIVHKKYRVRKVLKAEQILRNGLVSEKLGTAVEQHVRVWIAGQEMCGNDSKGTLEKLVQERFFGVATESYQIAVSKILDKTIECIKTVRIGRQSKPFKKKLARV